MKISTKGRYAIRIMLDIAQNGADKRVSLKDIARRQEISVKYMEQIIGQLCKAGMLKSTRGAQGGYTLTKQPAQYSIGEILRITEGELVPVACLEGEENACLRREFCATLGFWEGLYETINQYVDRFSLQDLLEEEKKGCCCEKRLDELESLE